MKTHVLKQGDSAWHAHRLQHWNASDAPAMLGCSPYKTRTQLLQELKTGIAPEVDASTQRRYDDGHRFEELARPLGEDVIGEDLEPVVGTEGKYSASFDGLTLAGDTAFEHKTLNSQLKAALMSDAGADALPKAYRVQMEQQLMVSGAERVLFMASKWEGDTLVEEMHDWYEPDAELRAEIIAGWAQFAIDLEAYEPQTAVIEKVVAESVEALPAPIARATGELIVIDNFKEFEERLRRFLGRLIRDPKTDQDFADLDAQIKEIKRGREALKAARMQLRAQVEPIDRAEKTAEMLDKLMQENGSMAQRILDGEKERRKGEIVAAGVSALNAHVDALNKRLGQPFMPKVPVDFGGAIKGLKSLASMEDKVDAALAQAKIAANATADRIDANLKHLNAHAGEYLALFPDVAALVLKEPQDFEAQVQFRVADQKAKDQKKADDLRATIAAEEKAKAEASVTAAQVVQTATATPPLASPSTASAAAPAPTVIPMPTPAAAAPASAPALAIGAINEHLKAAGVSTTAEGLRVLGFEPAGRERAAPRYHESDFPHMLAAIVAHVQSIQAKQAA